MQRRTHGQLRSPSPILPSPTLAAPLNRFGICVKLATYECVCA
jgi:hypothetical protein